MNPFCRSKKFLLSTNPTTSPVDHVREAIERRRNAAAMIECTLRDAGHDVTVDPDCLMVRPKAIHELTASRVISDQVCNLMHPHVNEGEFFHYTGRQGFAGIMQSQVLRLTQLSKRISLPPRIIQKSRLLSALMCCLPILLAKYMVRHMMADGAGRVVNISSNLASRMSSHSSAAIRCHRPRSESSAFDARACPGHPSEAGLKGAFALVIECPSVQIVQS